MFSSIFMHDYHTQYIFVLTHISSIFFTKCRVRTLDVLFLTDRFCKEQKVEDFVSPHRFEEKPTISCMSFIFVWAMSQRVIKSIENSLRHSIIHSLPFYKRLRL